MSKKCEEVPSYYLSITPVIQVAFGLKGGDEPEDQNKDLPRSKESFLVPPAFGSVQRAQKNRGGLWKPPRCKIVVNPVRPLSAAAEQGESTQG